VGAVFRAADIGGHRRHTGYTEVLEACGAGWMAAAAAGWAPSAVELRARVRLADNTVDRLIFQVYVKSIDQNPTVNPPIRPPEGAQTENARHVMIHIVDPRFLS